MKLYKINEIFHSIQGEGYHVGKPVIFIRFAGCNMKCSFCDTEHEEYFEMSMHDILEELDKYNCNTIVLTGGEPALFIDANLLAILKENNYSLHIETNGTVSLGSLKEYFSWITVSPKTNRMVQNHGDEIKVLFHEDYLHYLEQNLLFKHLYIQPVFVEDKPKDIEEIVKTLQDNPRWKLSVQLHKLLNLR